MHWLRRIVQRLFPVSKEESRQLFADLNRQFAELEKSNQEREKNLLRALEKNCQSETDVIMRAIEAHRQWEEAYIHSNLETLRHWQELFIQGELDTLRHWEESVIESHRQWEEEYIYQNHETLRHWQDAFTRGELETYRQWEEKAIEAHRQWEEEYIQGSLEILRQWQEKFVPSEFDAYHQWEERAMEAHRQWEEHAIEAHRQWEEAILITQYENHSANVKTYFWDNRYEKEAISNNWGDLSGDPEFKEKYLKLIHNLDEKSIETVNKILHRQNEYLHSNSVQLDLFTAQEQEDLRKIDEYLSKEILKVSDDMYAYRHYLLPINLFEPVVFYYKYCLYTDIDDLTRIKGKTIIDAGAFIGDTALIFAELNPDRIISFEPVSENMELLRKTISLNGLEIVIPEEKALGAAPGFLNMYIAGEGSTSLPREEDRLVYEEIPAHVPVVTLDQYVEDNNLEIGLIKADVEGSEPELLKGARKVISEQRPILIICIYHNSHDFFEIKTMLEEWNLGYKFKIRKPTVKNATYEAMLIAEPDYA